MASISRSKGSEEEAERRQREIREGRVQLVPGDEVKALLDRVRD